MISKRFTSILAAAVLFFASYTQAADPELCDTNCPSGDCCHVDDSIDFAYLNLVPLDYPSTSLSGNYTFVDGVGYDYALKLQLAQDAEFDYNYRFFTSNAQAQLSCADSKMWINGTTLDMTEVSIPDQENYCTIVIDGLVDRDTLKGAGDNIYFLFSDMVDEGTTFYAMQDISAPVVPQASVIYFRHAHTASSIVVDDVAGAVSITLTIEDIDHESDDFDPLACNDQSTTMQTLQLANCVLTRVSETANGNAFDHLYTLPRADYEACAASITQNGANIVYNNVLTLPHIVGECAYFQEQNGNTNQEFTIEVSADVTDTISDNFDNLNYQITAIEMERCPVEDYIAPQARAIFTFEVNFVGDSASIAGFSSGSPPYLGSIGSVLTDNALQLTNTACTSNTGRQLNTCVFTLKSTLCKNIYETNDGRCAFDRNQGTDLFQMDINEVAHYNQTITLTHAVPTINTNLELEVFPTDQCQGTSDLQLVNVNDQYSVETLLRNIPDQGTTIDWATPPDFVEFYKDVILRMQITDADIGSTSLFIKNVLVRILDPSDDSELQRYTFNVADKENVMGISYTGFYEDPHFCSYYDSSDSTCHAFYVDGTSRWNDYVQNNVNIPAVCQTSIDTRSMDFWTFSPQKWFKDIQLADVKVEFSLTATLHNCNNRRLLREDSRTLQTSTMSYLVSSQEFTFVLIQQQLPPVEQLEGSTGDGDGGSNTNTSTTVIPGSSITAVVIGKDDKVQTNAIIGASVVGGVLIISVLICWLKRRSGAVVDQKLGGFAPL